MAAGMRFISQLVRYIADVSLRFSLPWFEAEFHRSFSPSAHTASETAVIPHEATRPTNEATVVRPCPPFLIHSNPIITGRYSSRKLSHRLSNPMLTIVHARAHLVTRLPAPGPHS